MALYQETSNYELLAMFTSTGSVNCRRIDTVKVWDDATTPATLVSESYTPAVLISQEEAAVLIGSAFKAPPEPDTEDADESDAALV